MRKWGNEEMGKWMLIHFPISSFPHFLPFTR
jgi:hypothetical protein